MIVITPTGGVLSAYCTNGRVYTTLTIGVTITHTKTAPPWIVYTNHK